MSWDDRSRKYFEKKLREAGKELSQFPTQVDKLLPLLEKVEDLLANVEQMPVSSIEKAYSQCKKALTAEAFLRHTDVDVQVAVAICISELLRITAPEPPYDDDQMKEVFQLIVSSFKNLSDMSSRSYKKCVDILKSVAKVRSVNLMLDLDCNGLLSEMFQHFLSSIRDFHPENIFNYMETVMTLVLEESDDDSLSLELLTVILASLKRDNEEISSRARKLAESVLARCGVTLKPNLKQAVNSLGLPLDGYSEIVATICNESNSEVEHNDGDVSAPKEKTEALKVVSKLFGHDDKIVAIDKTDGAVEDFCTQNYEQISEKPEAAELVSKTYRPDDEIFAIDRNDGAADDFCTRNIGQISEKPDAAEMAVRSLFAGIETSMPASKWRQDLTTEFVPTLNSFSEKPTQNTSSKRANVSKNDNAGVANENVSDTHFRKLDILAAATDETTMPSSKRRRYLTIEDIQTQTDNPAFGDNAPECGAKPQSQSQATNSKRTTESKNGDEQSSKLAKSIDILAEALNDIIDSRKLPIPVEELWGFIHEMKLDGDLAGDAFVFLLDRPVQLKGLVSTPIGIRKSILLKMMMRDAK